MPLPRNYNLSCLYQPDKINAFVLIHELRNLFNTKNNREIGFSFCYECGARNKWTSPWAIESQIFAFRGSDPPLRLCGEFGHEVVGNLHFLDFFLDFFTEFKTYHLSYSVHKSSGDRLEKLDRVEGFFKDAIVNWNSFQEAYKDAYPSEGHMINWLFLTN